jgi:hypothetical protein
VDKRFNAPSWSEQFQLRHNAIQDDHDMIANWRNAGLLEEGT